MGSTLPESATNSAQWSVVRYYLVDRGRLFQLIRRAEGLPSLLSHMAIMAGLFSALYGLTVGLYAGGWQVLYNIIKFPGVILATLAVCVAALYVLNSLAGSRLSVLQTTAVVLSAILVTATLLAALTPPLAFLMLTSLREYSLVIFLNLVTICLAGAGGASFALQATKAVHDDEAVRTRCLKLMRVWMALYALVGLQMLWLFRPYFRATDVFIRPLGEGGSAFEAFGRLILNVIHSLL